MGRCSTALHKPKISKPCHLISFLGTLYPPNIRRANRAALVSFRAVSPAHQRTTPLHLGFFSWGTLFPGLPTWSQRRHVPLHRGHGHGASLTTSLGPGRQGSRPLYSTVRASGPPWSRPSARAGTGYHLLLPRRDCLPTLLPQRDRPGCNASPQDPELTPSGSPGTGHGKGPCSARARLGFPKVVPVTPPAALTSYRSRQLGFGARPDPATSRLDARAAQTPFALDRASQFSKCPGEGP